MMAAGFSAVVSALPAAAQTVLEVASFGAKVNSGEDATPAFQRAIAAVKEKQGRVVLKLAPGRYDFFSPQATRRKCFFSNATEPGTDGMRVIAIDLTGVKNLTISGAGAKLVMRGKMTMVVAERCENLAIRGVEFDFQRPTFSEIAAVEKGDGFWIGKVHADSDYEIREGKKLIWKGEDWADQHTITQYHDPVKDLTRRMGNLLADATAIEDLGERKLKFSVPQKSLGSVTPGFIYQFRKHDRDGCGMWFHRSKNVLLEDVKVRAMHGFGILSQFTENVTFRKLIVAPDARSGRTCASPADVLHFSGCRGKVRILDSVLTAAHDDAMNVHGTHLRIMERPAPDKLRLRFMHPQSWGFAAFAPGDEIELIHVDTMLPYAKAKVKAVEMMDSHEQVITLDAPAPEDIRLGSDAVENVTWTPEVEMRNCVIRRIPTRGVLLTTRRPILIEGTEFFRTGMHAVLLENDARGWYESGPVHDLRIEGNRFFHCAESVIQIEPQISKFEAPVHKNIRVKGNTFVLSRSSVLYSRGSDGISVMGNRISVPDGGPADAKAMIRTDNAADVTISRNTVSARKPGEEMEAGTKIKK